MRKIQVNAGGKEVLGIEVPLPKAPLVLAYGASGFVMCGYLNVEAADQLGVAAARVRGVTTVDDLLKAKVDTVTKAAAKKGVKAGMSGEEALEKLG